MKEIEVVTSFLESGGEILILKRSKKVGTYQESWAGVSGHLEHPPERQARIEIEEETGLTVNDIELSRRGEPLEVPDEEKGITWKVHPFLFRIKDREKIKIDWEHTEIQWIDPLKIGNYRTVPALKETLKRVLDNR